MQALRTFVNVCLKKKLEFFEFFETLEKALDDNKISFREGVRLAPELIDFVLALKHRGDIAQEWATMTSYRKTELITQYLRKIRVSIKNDLIQLYNDLMERAINILYEFSESFSIARQIRELKTT